MRSLCFSCLAIGAFTIATACSGTKAPPHDAPSRDSSLMTPQDLQALPSQPPDQRVAYGVDSSQYGELRVPPGPGPHPVVVLIHGGCFKAAYGTLRDLAPMGDALKTEGIATWNIEYRRLGQPGGGWTGTYLDVGHAVDYLRQIADQYQLDLGRVVLVGHSAGGHLAMWAAARARIPLSSPLHTKSPLPVRGAVDLAGPLDLTAHIPEYQALCGDTVITSLLGGSPAAVPDRYAHASPIRLLPLGMPQVLVIGQYEDFVPRPLVEAYAQAARNVGDSVRVFTVPGAGHFELASPQSGSWPRVEASIRSLLNGRLPEP